jgi:hypothetical protein
VIAQLFIVQGRAHIAGPSDILGMVGADFSNACRFSSLVYPEEVVDSEEG